MSWNVFGNVFGPGVSGGGGICNYPSIDDVRNGVAFGDGNSLIGNLVLPIESQVLVGVGYGTSGTELTGSLVEIPGGFVGKIAPVLYDGQLDSPLLIGNSYEVATGNAFVWSITNLQGFTAGGAVVHFRGWKSCACDGPADYDATGSLTDLGGGAWQAVVEMSVAETEAIDRDDYNWEMTIEESNRVVTYARGDVKWECV